MSTLTTIQASDLITNSRADINNNFSALNTDKMETSVLDTDTSLAANSDSKVATQKAVKTYIDTGGNPSSFTGMVGWFASSNARTGWLAANGQAVSRTGANAALFADIGTTFGIGDNSTTFNLPNVANRTIIMAGSTTRVATFASRASNVVTVTGLTNTANNEFQTGQAVLYHSTGSVMTGLSDNTTYYLVRTGNLTFSLAISLANAQAATVISLSSDGSGVQTFTLTLTTRTIGDMGGEENHAQSATEIAAHKHGLTYSNSFTAGGAGIAQGSNSAITGDTSNIANNTGTITAMNNMQPYIVLYAFIKT